MIVDKEYIINLNEKAVQTIHTRQSLAKAGDCGYAGRQTVKKPGSRQINKKFHPIIVTVSKGNFAHLLRTEESFSWRKVFSQPAVGRQQKIKIWQ